MSSAMACMATRLISSGAAKSGKPCDRFTAPYFMASRVISRITDSVNWVALRETRFEIEGAGVDRKSTRLNSSHQIISYAVFCLKKKKSKSLITYYQVHMIIDAPVTSIE